MSDTPIQLESYPDYLARKGDPRDRAEVALPALESYPDYLARKTAEAAASPAAKKAKGVEDKGLRAEDGDNK